MEKFAKRGFKMLQNCRLTAAAANFDRKLHGANLWKSLWNL